VLRQHGFEHRPQFIIDQVPRHILWGAKTMPEEAWRNSRSFTPPGRRYFYTL
jgi:hypothetical protein